MSTILITGGAGFIGSHLTEACLARGDRVLVVDDLSTGKREQVPAGAELFRVSVAHPRVREVVLSHRPEVLLHLAAQVSVRLSVQNPVLDAATNIQGLLTVLEAGRQAGCLSHVVLASTGGAVYGEQAPRPTPESCPPTPQCPYGCAKAAAELYLGYYRQAHGIPSACLRFANVFGPRQDPCGEAGVVAIFARGLLDGTGCRINGSGEQTRDFLFVEDVVRAALLAVERRFHGVVNIGTGVETSINQLYGMMAAQVPGADPDPPHGPALAGEQLHSCVDPALVRELLGWAPEVQLEEGLRRTLAWFEESGR